MRRTDTGLVLSATDFSRFLGCRHRTGLDLAVAVGALEREYEPPDPLLELLWKRGLAHEQAYVDNLRQQGKSVADLRDTEGTTEQKARRTIDAMATGVDAIVQGTLAGGKWMGHPDILQRVETPSTFGEWSYEVADTKLARETKAGTLLQLGLYSELLAAAQNKAPENFYVVTPNPQSPIETYRVNDYAAYFRLIQRQLDEWVAAGHVEITAAHYPDPVDHCEICDWAPRCRRQRREDDHLSLVAGISRTQRRELETQSVTTLTSLAAMPVPIEFKPSRGSRVTYERVREQARVQFESRDVDPPLYETLPVETDKDGKILTKGLCRLPDPTPGDLFLDLEGDPFAREGGREYLIGLVDAGGKYYAQWAFTDKEERAALEWLMDMIAERVAKHPSMHVYHYAPYEPSALKRLTQRYVTREDALDEMLRAGRLVDLYGVVRQGLRAGVERYSIKNLEPLYGFPRDVELRDAHRFLKVMECALETGQASAVPDDVRRGVEGYNRDDCVSTLKLRDWLEDVRAKLIADGTDVPRPVLGPGDPPEPLSEAAAAVEALRARLLDGLPETRDERTDEQQGRWLLAYLLDYHRREEKATWWEYFRMCDLPEDDLYDETKALAGLEFVRDMGKVNRSFVYRYRYPPQQVELDVKDKLHGQDSKHVGVVAAIDRESRTIDIKQGPKTKDERPTAVFEFEHVGADAMEGSLFRIGTAVADGTGEYTVARRLLAAERPRLDGQVFDRTAGEHEVDFARRAVMALDDSALAVQGPPGAGKTFCGSQMIVDLVRAGRKVGVTGSSHKVIVNLLNETAKAARNAGVDARVAHKDDDPVPEGIALFNKNEAAAAALATGEANVLGGTAWLWSRPEFANTVDVLFVDEAGQMALANVVAMSPCARAVVLLGDPQQLEQVRKGTHPDGVGGSALEHLLGDHNTMPPERGIFLPETWRLAPSVCAFTSEIFYEGRLKSRAGLDKQRLVGAAGLPEHGLLRVNVKHDGNRNASDEEAGIVADLVSRLLAPGVSWIDGKGTTKPMTAADVLVVAPYNAQVSRIAERLAGTGVAVGTVDKFQGQEAPVVIYSMATSTPEDAPRGMEFLYSLNRLNVATSRARCLAILVSSPALFEPECRSPRQMQLANGLCRFAEMAAAND